ncbi:MAG: hypothetical protein Q8L48_11800 [Archangium sp.]|nr:hypothetical protein [Archangium sp.]
MYSRDGDSKPRHSWLPASGVHSVWQVKNVPRRPAPHFTPPSGCTANTSPFLSWKAPRSWRASPLVLVSRRLSASCEVRSRPFQSRPKR